MKPRHSKKTFWLLALLLAALPLTAGCWLDDESALTDRRPNAQSSPGVSASSSRSTTSGRGGSMPSANKIQIINVSGQTPGLQFGSTKFKLVTRNDLVNQYIPVDQTLDNWEAMFVIRQFPELSSPQEAIDNVRNNLIQEGTDPSLIAVQKGGRPEDELAIDFIIWTDDKSLTEFNVHVYRKINGRMIANMYLMRGYGVQGHNTLSAAIAANRELILQSVLDSQFPLFLQ